MKLYVFGSCSGTEPYENRHHTALAFEIGERIYWFDAGESCSHTAHVMGVDLLRVSDIFISHPHIDHVGGLANLLFTIRKLSIVKKEEPKFGGVTVHTPSMETWRGVMLILQNAEGSYKTPYRSDVESVQDGLLLDKDGVRVTACHNRHIPPTETGYRSFSYLIEAEGKRIVYSGDVKDLDDLAPFLAEGCDLLLMETGHHDPTVVSKRLSGGAYDVKKLYFMHHGRMILRDYEGALERCREDFPSVVFCNDRDVFKL